MTFQGSKASRDLEKIHNMLIYFHISNWWWGWENYKWFCMTNHWAFIFLVLGHLWQFMFCVIYDWVILCHLSFGIYCSCDLWSDPSYPPPHWYKQFKQKYNKIIVIIIVMAWIGFSYLYFFVGCPWEIQATNMLEIWLKSDICTFFKNIFTLQIQNYFLAWAKYICIFMQKIQIIIYQYGRY